MPFYAIDPELREDLPGIPDYDLRDVHAARRDLLAEVAAAGPVTVPDGVEIHPRTATGPDGHEVRVRVTAARAGASDRPLVLVLHGGGFVLGDAQVDDADAVDLVVRLGAVVVAVDYRLAPEHPFPAALDDAVAALHWATSAEAGLGVDPGRVAVSGGSAGGCIAASLCQRVRDEGGPAIRFAHLAIPVLDDRLTTPSARAYTDTPLWYRRNAALSWDYYLGPHRDRPPRYAVPNRTEDLAGLPPTHLSVTQFDPLRDEALDYAARLAQANVPTELHLYPGTFHASYLISGPAVSTRMIEDRVAALARGLDV